MLRVHWLKINCELRDSPCVRDALARFKLQALFKIYLSLCIMRCEVCVFACLLQQPGRGKMSSNLMLRQRIAVNRETHVGWRQTFRASYNCMTRTTAWLLRIIIDRDNQSFFCSETPSSGRKWIDKF